MGFDRRSVRLVVPATPATITSTLNARSTYIRPISHKVLLTGTDTTVRLKLTDADSRVFYLDAADKDYKTAAINTPIHLDDVTTGIGPKIFDSVGAAGAATQPGPMPVVRSPITVEISNGGTGGDIIDVELDYEYGCFYADTFTTTVTAGNTASSTRSLRAKYAQVLGIKALSVGTSTTLKLKVADADGKIVFLDAAAADYDTAALDKVLFLDATVTGLTGVVPRNATGAAVQASVGNIAMPLVRSPLTFTVLEDEANDAAVTTTLYYKTG